MNKSSKIYVAGHRGLVGSAICRELRAQGFTNIVCRTRAEVNLSDPVQVQALFLSECPDYVFVAAAKVGGIKANNDQPADFAWENLLIQNNLIHYAHLVDVKKLLFLGSSCIYPKHCPQPIKEDYLLTGLLEPTNEAYAIAKIAGIIMCQAYRKQHGCDFISAMPTNLYGPGDNYDPQSSHVLPALIRRFHEAKLSGATSVTCWGTGTPMREFLHSDDAASACVFLMNNYSDSRPINVGCGHDISIKDLTLLVKEVVGYTGDVEWDSTKPDGTPRKLLDCSRLFDLAWRPKIGLAEGIARTYAAFQESGGDR